MNFLRSRAEHLADHLRDAIERGELVEPLPNLRDWSASLGVAHGTLEKALSILKRDGLVRSRLRKGIHLVRDTPVRRRLQEPPFVRLIEGHNMPFISIDVLSAVRHAAFLLARRGFERVTLVINEASRRPIEEEFLRICAAAPRPVRGEVVRLPDELYAQNLAAQRLASRVTARHGLIVNSPIHAGLLIMAVASRGWKLGDDVEVVAVNATPQEIRTYPIPIHYPHPLERFSRALCQAAIRYFEQGALPSLRKMIPLEMVSPPR